LPGLCGSWSASSLDGDFDFGDPFLYLRKPLLGLEADVGQALFTHDTRCTVRACCVSASQNLGFCCGSDRDDWRGQQGRRTNDEDFSH
jgi:hypothetical protein